MDGNEIGLFEDSLKIDQFEAARKVSIRVDVRIISDDVHRHRLAFARPFTADASEADDTECFSRELDALNLLFSHLWLWSVLYAWGILRAIANSIATVC